MGLDIWFKDDIANIVRAANEANLSALRAGSSGSTLWGSAEADLELRRAYRRGFVSALATLAQALGLPVPEIERELTVLRAESRQSSGTRRLAPPVVRVGGQRCEN